VDLIKRKKMEEVLTKIYLGHVNEAIGLITKDVILKCTLKEKVELIENICLYSDPQFDDPSFLALFNDIELERFMYHNLIMFLWMFHKKKCARYVIQKYPFLFSDDLFSECLSVGWNNVFIYMIDEGYHCEHMPSICIDFSDARKRAKTRAMVVLSLPRRRRESGVGITKDVAQIIARVIWESRKFN